MAVPKLAASMRWLVGGAAGAALLGPAGVALADKADKKPPQGPLFDPEALERGAKALREINSSPHAKQARPSAQCARGASPHDAVAPRFACGCCRWRRRTCRRRLTVTPHACTHNSKPQQVIALSREQEVTKQQELKTDEAKFAAQAASAAAVSGWLLLAGGPSLAAGTLRLRCWRQRLCCFWKRQLQLLAAASSLRPCAYD